MLTRLSTPWAPPWERPIARNSKRGNPRGQSHCETHPPGRWITAMRHTAPSPQSNPVTQAPRLVAHVALSVASGLGVRILAAGPALRRLYSDPGRLCVRRQNTLRREPLACVSPATLGRAHQRRSVTVAHQQLGDRDPFWENGERALEPLDQRDERLRDERLAVRADRSSLDLLRVVVRGSLRGFPVYHVPP